MRLSGILFALCLGAGMPMLLVGAGVNLPDGRLAAWAVAAFAVGYAIPAGLDYLTHDARAEDESNRRQRDANSELTLAHAAEIQARLQVPAAVETPPDTTKAWEGAIETFLMAGDVRGFSIRRMQGVVGSDVWEQLTTMLADVGWLAKVPGRGYRWADEYGLARALLELRAGNLPYPTGPAPVVNVVPNGPTLRNAPRQGVTVIQGN